METARIAELLRPFLPERQLSPDQLHNISTYIDILLRWNARMNLTAVREPEEIVTRHFGESLFAAWNLFPDTGEAKETAPSRAMRVADVGSGAGFPGLPIKIWAPDVHLTLIESHQKKATFLREAVRALTLTGVDVFSGRAEDFPAASADVVTLRAVEHFEAVLPLAAKLVAPKRRMALLIGNSQSTQARELAPELSWRDPVPVPMSSARVLQIASRGESK